MTSTKLPLYPITSFISCHRRYSQSKCRKAVVFSSVFHRPYPSWTALIVKRRLSRRLLRRGQNYPWPLLLGLVPRPQLYSSLLPRWRVHDLRFTHSTAISEQRSKAMSTVCAKNAWYSERQLSVGSYACSRIHSLINCSFLLRNSGITCSRHK